MVHWNGPDGSNPVESGEPGESGVRDSGSRTFGRTCDTPGDSKGGGRREPDFPQSPWGGTRRPSDMETKTE